MDPVHQCRERPATRSHPPGAVDGHEVPTGLDHLRGIGARPGDDHRTARIPRLGQADDGQVGDDPGWPGCPHHRPPASQPHPPAPPRIPIGGHRLRDRRSGWPSWRLARDDETTGQAIGTPTARKPRRRSRPASTTGLEPRGIRPMVRSAKPSSGVRSEIHPDAGGPVIDGDDPIAPRPDDELSPARATSPTMVNPAVAPSSPARRAVATVVRRNSWAASPMRSLATASPASAAATTSTQNPAIRATTDGIPRQQRLNSDRCPYRASASPSRSVAGSTPSSEPQTCRSARNPIQKPPPRSPRTGPRPSPCAHRSAPAQATAATPVPTTTTTPGRLPRPHRYAAMESSTAEAIHAPTHRQTGTQPCRVRGAAMETRETDRQALHIQVTTPQIGGGRQGLAQRHLDRATRRVTGSAKFHRWMDAQESDPRASLAHVKRDPHAHDGLPGAVTAVRPPQVSHAPDRPPACRATAGAATPSHDRSRPIVEVRS